MSPEIVPRQTLSVKITRANLILNVWLAGTGLALGIANLIAGPKSWSNQSFTIARSVPGSTYTWAICLIVFTLIFIVGAVQETKALRNGIIVRHRLFIAGAVLCALWNSILAWCQLQQMAVDSTDISWNGPILWSAMGILWILKAAINY